MKFILGWSLKLAFVGAIYLGFTSGMKLPDRVFGYKVPDEAHQLVERTAKIADFGKQTQDSFKNIASGLK